MAAVAGSQAHGLGTSRPTSPPSPQSPRSGDAMDVSPTNTSAMRPPNGTQILKSSRLGDSSKKPSAPATGAAAAVSNSKVVQSAFVHKLYSMLEDDSIQHLISWSSSNESFLISPSNEFSKVLSTYFKHTNVSSFVRQLNMYGFHKVSDVFHTGSSETPLWEFKHGGGSFKKGDMESLRDIKRRASRHALIHRDSFSSMPKPPPPQQPPLPNVPPDSTEARLGILEQSLFDMHGRLARSEESNAMMAAKCQELTDQLANTYQHNQELSGHLASLVEDPHHPVRRSISTMQTDIQRHLDSLRKPLGATSPNGQIYMQRPFDSSPTSPHAMPFDDRRRASIQVLPSQNQHRPLAASPVRHGSFGTARSSPGTSRLAPPPPPSFYQQSTPPLPSHHPQIPAVAVEPPAYLPRRHTSADIHSTNEWSMHHPHHDNREPALPSPFAASYSNGAAPMPPMVGGDRQLQDKLASYSFGGPSQSTSTLPPPAQRDRGSVSHQSSRASSPPPPGHLAPPQAAEPSWAQPAQVRMPFRDVWKASGIASPVSSGAPSRRSSMANIHNMLNPADSLDAEDPDEDQRKRKRRG